MPAAEVTATPTAADLTELPLEALMNIEVPKVYGASKLEQKETEAPASVTVVTADEIIAPWRMSCGACRASTYPMTATMRSWEPAG